MPPVLHSTGPCPSMAPPSESPKGARSNPPLLFDNTAKHGVQDELFLRSATLKVYLSLWLKTAYSSRILGLHNPLRPYPLCSDRSTLPYATTPTYDPTHEYQRRHVGNRSRAASRVGPEVQHPRCCKSPRSNRRSRQTKGQARHARQHQGRWKPVRP